MFDIEKIQKVLPHRFPFLLIDRVLEVEPGKRAVALKNVSINEGFFSGHFPGNPVMPETLIMEAMAQASIMLLADDAGEQKKFDVYLGSVKADFLHPVRPGDQLKITVEAIKIVSEQGLVSVTVEVEGKPVARGQIGFGVKWNSVNK